MIPLDELRIDNLILKVNPNAGVDKPEICKVFFINRKDCNVSIRRLRKCLHNGAIIDLPKVGENDTYIFPSNPVDFNLILPIPLTEEILSKSPDVTSNSKVFINPRDVDDQEEKTYFLGNIKLIDLENGEWKAEYYSLENVLNNHLILYVHELQNLYFSLTNNPLTLDI